MSNKPELGIYIHIPFCMQKCFYCDFISFPNMKERHKQYIEKLIDEINKERELFNKYEVTTIYIGGGTPSLIESTYIEQILSNLKEVISKDTEITIEVNPGTVTKRKLQIYKKAGINRLSIGLQTTNDKLLKSIGRIHTYSDFLNTSQMAIDIGFENINVDLMIGLPNQSINDIKESLQKVMNFQHISVYSLIVESGTEIEKMLEKGDIQLPTEEEERMQYHYVKNVLENKGYKHYEISNFAIPGKCSKHNLNCWEQKEYIGFGISAHSYINKIRFSNTENIEKYLYKDYKEIKVVHERQVR